MSVIANGPISGLGSMPSQKSGEAEFDRGGLTALTPQ
jgi:hypothetical protein